MSARILQPTTNRYKIIIEEVFRRCEREGTLIFPRDWFVKAARDKDVVLPKNLGDLPYYFRFRIEFPEYITAKAPSDKEWMLALAGGSRYRFKLVSKSRLLPREGLVAIKIPDSTPEIIRDYSFADEQALLAILRYNRLIDIFLGVAAYSLQNHLRTSVKIEGKRSQIEIDELYVAVSKSGQQFVIPVQAKGGKDKLSPVQVEQDVMWCKERYPDIVCRPIAAQFLADGVVAMFELLEEDGEIKIKEERHYVLVQASEIDRKR